MTSRSKIIATVLAASLGVTGLSTFASADTTAPATAAATAAAPAGDVISASAMQIPETGHSVLMGVQVAKMALAEDNTDVAKEVLAKISTELNDQAAGYVMKTDAGYGLPLDTALSFADGFAPNDSQKPAIEAAVGQIEAGDIDAALATLKAANIDVHAQIALMPFKSTVDSIKQASDELNNGNSEKAFAALDAIPGTIKVEKFATDALPHQGYELTEILQG